MNINRIVRHDVIGAYDDSNGVNAACHRILMDACLLYGWSDIQDKVQDAIGKDGYRYYIGEEDAESLRNVMDEPNLLLTPVTVGGGVGDPLRNVPDVNDESTMRDPPVGWCEAPLDSPQL